MKRGTIRFILSLFIALFSLMLATIAVSASEVALVVEFPDGSIHKECISTTDATNGYELLQASRLADDYDLLWSDFGAMGHFLNSIDGIEAEQVDDVWSFWQLSARTDDNWFSAQFAWDSDSACWNRDKDSNVGHYCAVNGDIIGLTHSSDFPSFPSSSHEFKDICHFGIVDMDVRVDGKSDKNLWHMDKIDEEGNPGSLLKFNIKFENFYTDEDDTDIEDVKVTVTLKDVDGDDIEVDYDEFAVKQGKTKTIDLELEVPVLIEEDDNYEIDIEVESVGDGGIGDGVDFDFTWTLLFDVDKKKHELMVRYANLDAPTVACGNKVGVSTKVTNIGEAEEDDVAVEILAPSLNFDYVENKIGLSDDPFDTDSSWSTTQFIELPDGIVPGTYEIYIKVYYDGKLSDEETLLLEKQECTLSLPGGEEPAPGAEASLRGVVRVVYAEPPTGAVTAALTSTAPLVSSPEQVQQKEKPASETFYITLLVLVLLASVIMFVLIIVYIVNAVK